ncbi:MAG TPA: translation elongation factor 4 [Planctomycetota bacterium]|nr:translation elongation factor 4 [Planctomycetota bacterium]
MSLELTRNFCIIAHIDHGKSTLADRLLLKCGAITEREFQNQMLDDMDLERERGITIKASAVTIEYKRPADGKTYTLNLIDTPGHVDFNYEVSRSLAACEGALLLVDATQGVEAQTVANSILAHEHNLDIVPVLNKIDLASAQIDASAAEVEQVLGIQQEKCILASGKEGIGVDEILEAVVTFIKKPAGDDNGPLRALIFDCKYDDYRGVITYIRVVDGKIKKGDRIRMHHSGKSYEVAEIGRFRPKPVQCDLLTAGDVGYLTATLKDIHEVKVGDTIESALVPKEQITPLPGYKEPKPMVFCGLFPANQGSFESLKRALDKLALNDSAFVYQAENSDALGFGFRCGFLGLLHMEIVQERLEREFNIELVQTAPNVTYEILLNDDSTMLITSPSKAPDPTRIKAFREPIAKVQVIVPTEYIGSVIKLCEDRRGKFIKQEYIGQTRVMVEYEMPLAEIVFDYYDRLKSATKGYGTMDYHFIGYQESNLAKVDILVHGTPVDALSMICHRETAEQRARRVLVRLRKQIPKHLFVIALQAAIGGKIIARESISATAKNVTSKCYGGDITRKRKLLEKQKEGKKKMRSRNIGAVEVPQDAFLAVLDTRDDDED